jgi:hypothetical protein
MYGFGQVMHPLRRLLDRESRGIVNLVVPAFRERIKWSRCFKDRR